MPDTPPLYFNTSHTDAPIVQRIVQQLYHARPFRELHPFLACFARQHLASICWVDDAVGWRVERTHHGQVHLACCGCKVEQRVQRVRLGERCVAAWPVGRERNACMPKPVRRTQQLFPLVRVLYIRGRGWGVLGGFRFWSVVLCGFWESEY